MKKSMIAVFMAIGLFFAMDAGVCLANSRQADLLKHATYLMDKGRFEESYGVFEVLSKDDNPRWSSEGYNGMGICMSEMSGVFSPFRSYMAMKLFEKAVKRWPIDAVFVNNLKIQREDWSAMSVISLFLIAICAMIAFMAVRSYKRRVNGSFASSRLPALVTGESLISKILKGKVLSGWAQAVAVSTAASIVVIAGLVVPYKHHQGQVMKIEKENRIASSRSDKNISFLASTAIADVSTAPRRQPSKAVPAPAPLASKTAPAVSHIAVKPSIPAVAERRPIVLAKAVVPKLRAPASSPARDPGEMIGDARAVPDRADAGLSPSQTWLLTAHKGDSLIRIAKRQMLHDPDAFRYKSDKNDKDALKAWADRVSYLACKETGLISPEGAEIRISQPEKVRYIWNRDHRTGKFSVMIFKKDKRGGWMDAPVATLSNASLSGSDWEKIASAHYKQAPKADLAECPEKPVEREKMNATDSEKTGAPAGTMAEAPAKPGMMEEKISEPHAVPEAVIWQLFPVLSAEVPVTTGITATTAEPIR